MREKWNRATDNLAFTNEQLQALIWPALPSAQVASAELAQGGLANTNIKVELAGDAGPLLIRFFVRDPAQAGKEFRLSQLEELRGVMPEYVFFSQHNQVNQYPYVIMQWVDGVRLELEIGRVSPIELANSLGKTMARIHSIGFERTGFFDDQLNVVSPVELGGEGLAAHARECLLEGRGLARLGEKFTAQFCEFIERQGSILDHWPGACLSHSDFGGSNILIKGAQVQAVLDWEFAFSGNPAFDFGNLLRADFGPGFEEALAKSYIDNGGRLPTDWRRISLMADLYSWMDFLNRPEAGPALIADARRKIEETMCAC